MSGREEFDAIMAKVREEQRAGRSPEQELRDALTAISPLIEREDVEDDEWIHAFEKEVPTLVDAAYRFLGEQPGQLLRLSGLRGEEWQMLAAMEPESLRAALTLLAKAQAAGDA